jgi:hypothetical protein
VSAVGIASMAESGLLVEPASGSLRSEMIPGSIRLQPRKPSSCGSRRPQERFRRAGIRPNFKCSLAKLLGCASGKALSRTWSGWRQPIISPTADRMYRDRSFLQGELMPSNWSAESGMLPG